MKNAVLIFGICCLLASSACGQRGGQLFSIDEPAKGPKEKPKAVVTDGKAVENWWKELHGTDDKLRIFEMNPRKKPKDFEVDTGDITRSNWVNLEEWLKEEARDAVAFSAKVGSADSKTGRPVLFVVRNGEVIYHKNDKFKSIR